MFGNSLPIVSEQVENMCLARVISLNSVDFDFNQCSFAESNMNAVDKNGGLSREGSGRVSIWKATGIPNCYTLECHYSIGVSKNKLTKHYDYKLKTEVSIEEETKEVKEAGVVDHPYTIESYEYVGKAVCVGILDFYELNPISRLPTTKLKNLKGVKQEMLQKIEEEKIKSNIAAHNKLTGKKTKAKSSKASENKAKVAKFCAPYKKAADSFMMPKVVIKRQTGKKNSSKLEESKEYACEARAKEFPSQAHIEARKERLKKSTLEHSSSLNKNIIQKKNNPTSKGVQRQASGQQRSFIKKLSVKEEESKAKSPKRSNSKGLPKKQPLSKK